MDRAIVVSHRSRGLPSRVVRAVVVSRAPRTFSRFEIHVADPILASRARRSIAYMLRNGRRGRVLVRHGGVIARALLALFLHRRRKREDLRLVFLGTRGSTRLIVARRDARRAWGRFERCDAHRSHRARRRDESRR